MRRRINWRVFLYLLAGTVVLAGGVHFLHAAQVRRNASALLEQSIKFEEANKATDAAHFLGLYLKRVPSDTDARERLLLLRVKLAHTKKQLQAAYQGLEDFLRGQPDREKVRREAIRLAMSPQLARYSDARHHLEHLLKEKPDANLELLYGNCWLAEKRYKEAAAQYAKAIERDPKEPTAYVLRAHVLRERLDQGDDANRVMDQLVEKVGTAPALLARANYRKRFGKPEDVASDVRKAEGLAGNDPDVILAVAEVAREAKQFDAARKALKKGVELHAKDLAFYSALARLEVHAGQIAEGITWLRKGLEALPERPELLWELATLLADARRADEVSELIGRLRAARVPPARLEFLDARVLVLKNRWHDAIRVLQHAGPELQSWPELVPLADLLLGECYAQLADVNNQYKAFQRAAKADPLWVPACIGLAQSLEKLGRSDDAIDVYRRILPKHPRAGLSIARLLIARNAALPAAEQRWQAFDELLAAHKDIPETRHEVAALHAQTLIMRGRSDLAYKQLDEACRGSWWAPPRLDLLIARASLAAHCGRELAPKTLKSCVTLALQHQPLAAAADASVSLTMPVVPDPFALLDDAERLYGDVVEIRMARADLWSRLGRQGQDGFLGVRQGQDFVSFVLTKLIVKPWMMLRLEVNQDRFSGADRFRLWRGLADAHLRMGDYSQARRLYGLLAQEQPNDLSLRITLFDLALLQEDLEVVSQAVQDVRRVEGPDGIFWRYARANELLIRARRKDRSGLDEARKLLKTVADRDASWSARVALCEAEIATLNGEKSLAITKYQEAVRQGERRPSVLRLLAELLNEQRRYTEADAVMKLLPAQSLDLIEVRRLAAEVSVQTGDHDRALQLARTTSATSKDYRDHVWLGQILWASRKWDEAELSFRKAIELAPKSAGPHIALVQFLARTGKKELAVKAIDQARTSLASDNAAIALAQCYEAVGDAENARQHYDGALKDRPKDVVVLRAAVAFQVRSGDLPGAEAHLQRMLEVKPLADADAAWARRTLAKVLALQGDYAKSRRAIDMLAEQGNTGDPAEDARTRAMVLGVQLARADRLEGIRILQELGEKQSLLPEDRFLLAQLHESVGDWRRAHALLFGLVTADENNPNYLSRFIVGLLRHDAPVEAANWLAQLEKIRPSSYQTLELKCRLLRAEGKGDEAASLLAKHAEKKEANLLRVARLLAELDQPKAAEAIYRRWVEQVKTPQATLALAMFLARQNRLAEALDLCRQARKTMPPEKVMPAALEAVYAASVDRACCEEVAGWIQQLLDKAPKNAMLLTALGAVRSRLGDFDQAIALYQRALAADPNEALAMNNLAYLLAMKKGKGTESLVLLDRAEKIVGAVPELLDTRATVLWKLGKADAAIAIMEDIVGVNPTPAGYFRLARALLAAKQPLPAQTAWKEAQARGLQPTDLHPLERDSYGTLKADIAKLKLER